MSWLVSLAIVVAVLAIALLSASTAQADECSAGSEPATVYVAEDGWWQTDGRTYETWVTLGPRAGLLGETDAPMTESLSTGVWGAALAAGHWVHPMIGVESVATLGGNEVSGAFGAAADIVEATLAVGVRFGLPILITPLVAAHVGYRFERVDWTTEGGVSSGFDQRDALYADGQVGVGFGHGMFVGSLVGTAAVELGGSTARETAATAAANGSRVTNVGERGAGSWVSAGVEVHAGVRW